MQSSSSESPQPDHMAYLDIIASQAFQSNTLMQNKMSTWKGKRVSKVKGHLPQSAIRHIQIHKELEKTIHMLEGKGHKIPKAVKQTLQESKGIVGSIANTFKYNEFLSEMSHGLPKTVDTYGFLTSESGYNIPTVKEEWSINLGLLMNVYNRTKNPELKKQIYFFALNYLAKSAPANIEMQGLKNKEDEQKLHDLFQLGFFDEAGAYSRERPVFEEYLWDVIKDEFIEDSGAFHLTDTSDFSNLLPMKYFVVESGLTPEKSHTIWTEGMVKRFVEELKKNNNQLDLNTIIKPPLLFDFTSFLGDFIRKTGDPKKDKLFDQKFKIIDDKLNEAVISAAKKIKETHPDLKIDIKTLEAFIRANITCICRSEIKGIGVLKNLPVFWKEELFAGGIMKGGEGDAGAKAIRYKLGMIEGWLEGFLNHAGLRLGAVRGRANIFEHIDLPYMLKKDFRKGEIVEYSVTGPNTLYFSKKEDILKSNLMMRFEKHFEEYDKMLASKPHQAILGMSTVKLVKGLFQNITEEKWNELNKDPDTRQILQTTLTRLMNHLATSDHNLEDFTKFSQAIELVHCELATLLAITMPFKESDFARIYKSQLTHIPAELRSMARFGVGKSAMNIFSGVTAALIAKNKGVKPECTYAEGSYFEVVELLGRFLGAKRSAKDVRENKDIKRVDLLVGEFNHNMNIDPTYTTYKGTNIIAEINMLLKAKPDTKHLTIAIDETIDFAKSPKVKELLEQFSEEIKAGKLNFVFFRSGQKFDMLGMDNYYGAPFYMVNNGGEQWKDFGELTTSDTFKTDPLSMQWFCLANKYSFKIMDDYRRTIFKNAERILDKVPEKLKPGKNPKIRVNLVEKGKDSMDAAFIDIKIQGDDIDEVYKIKRDIENRLFHKFAEHNKKIHARGSFGFYHPNFNVITNLDGFPRHVRINPGLDSADSDIIIELLEELAEEYARSAS